MQELLLQRYRILEEAGSGGYARVLLAFDTVIQRRVAIKELSLDRARESASGVIPGLEEARTAALLQDPHIVGVLDFSVQEDTAYLIMEYIDGASLGQLLREDPLALSCNALASVLSQVSLALTQAHENQILHLDIKPDNILIDHKGCVKVADFGLAQLSSAQGFSQARGGTISYMPPEQMQLKELDARTDEWALASLVYEILAGENPFRARDLKQAQKVIEDAELLLPSLCREGLSSDIDDIIFKALDPNKEERFETVEEFAHALIPYLGKPSRGTHELAKLVEAHCSDFEEAEDADAAPQNPLLLKRPEFAGQRLSAAWVAAVFGFVSQYALGLQGFEAALLIAAAVAVSIVSFFWIRVGLSLAFAMLTAALFFAQSYVLAFIFGAVALLYFITYGTKSKEASLLPAFPALLGIAHINIGLPFLCGLILKPRAAAASAFLGSLVMLVLGTCSGGDITSYSLSILAGWDVSRFGELLGNAFVQPLTYAYLIAAPAMAALVSRAVEMRWKVVQILGILGAAALAFGLAFLCRFIASGGVIPSWDTGFAIALGVSVVASAVLLFFINSGEETTELEEGEYEEAYEEDLDQEEGEW